MSQASEFTKRLRGSVRPLLQNPDFDFDGSRTFRRVTENSILQIVNFQIGLRSLQGRFTVNLAVCHLDSAGVGIEPMRLKESDCAMDARQRLGFLIPARFSTFSKLPGIGLIFRPRDKWWRVEDEVAFALVCDAIRDYGLPWLEGRGRELLL